MMKFENGSLGLTQGYQDKLRRSSLYQKFIRPLMFRLDPEQAHELTLQVLCFTGAFSPLRRLVHKLFEMRNPSENSVEVFGLKFPNPVGLAAGYDKDGLAWRGLATMGFGHIEVGTVTPQPQTGNPKPRIFRIPEECAVINRMGFPGKGAEVVARNVRRSTFERSNLIIGINMGKNKDTPNEEAAKDYLSLLEIFSPLADYLVVNVSSPNTVGLRRLQTRDLLEDLLLQMKAAVAWFKVKCPILVKIAPDLTSDELEDVLEAIIRSGIDGVIATNTTVSRAELKSGVGKETGGLSGAPLATRSRLMVADIYHRTKGNLPIIGVGGIMNSEDAKMMLDSGASLIQVYTGLVYAGPGLVRAILESL
jgi:dihydroorotate dehydrogenase